LNEVQGQLDKNFLYDAPSQEEQVYGAAKGLVATYNDPYTIFVEPQTAELDTGNLAGRFGGIGAEIAQDADGKFVITRVYPDNPAVAAGVMEGDTILAVDGIDVTAGDYDLNRLIALIRGDIGDPVTLSIMRNDTQSDIEIVRGEVLIPAVFWRILEEDPRVGYLQITRFTDRAPDETVDALTELEADGAQAIILDLRNNGGGLVDSTIQIAGNFLDGGTILFEQQQDSIEQVKNAPRGGSATDLPMIVLVNGNTASSAEILAGALQDRQRALLIGESTYGKGSVQFILPLSDGASLHVTTAQWFTPNHHRIEGTGLTPDVIIIPSAEIDAELQAALERLVPQLDQ
jgi:carboxyl-terminal processing protease